MVYKTFLLLKHRKTTSGCLTFDKNQFMTFVLAIFLAVIFSRAHIFASAFSGFLAKFFQSLVYGILSCGLILSFLCTFLPVEVLSQFSNFSQNIFNKDVARFLWLALPLVFILFSLKFKGHKGPGRPALE